MAKRENDKQKTIDSLSDIVFQVLLNYKDGTRTTIKNIVRDYYNKQGYEFIYIGPYIGWVWSKDKGITYSIEDTDLFDVLDIVERKLKHKRKLVFDNKNCPEGLPYNLSFTVRIK